MKTVTISLADFASIDGELTREQWSQWYKARNIDWEKVLRSYPNQEQTATIFECED